MLKHEIGGILSNPGKNTDSDARCLARAAHIVRREVLDVKNSFNGQFQEGCQKHSVPPSLLTLLGMIMKGQTTKCDHSENQTCCQSHSLWFIARQRSEATGATHHRKSRECPLSIYTALKLHGATRDKALIDSFYNLGICISYDKLMSFQPRYRTVFWNVLSVTELFVHLSYGKTYLQVRRSITLIIIQALPPRKVLSMGLQYL